MLASTPSELWMSRRQRPERDQRAPSGSEFRMKPAGEDGDRAAVGVVARIEKQLIVEGERRPLVDAPGVVRLHDILPAIVEAPVANQNPQATGLEVGPRLARQSLAHAGNTDPILGPAPAGALQHGAERNAVADIGPADDLDLSWTPARAR